MPTGAEEFVRPDGVRVRFAPSARRKRTVSASWRDGVAVVAVPARMTRAERERWALRLVDKLVARERRQPAGDAELAARADRLDALYLESRARPTSVRWVTNQRRRWGSATPAEGSIRLSSRLQGMPAWVVDFVLVHELCHLVADDGHGPRFSALQARYPQAERAQAFLDGVSWASDREGPGGDR